MTKLRLGINNCFAVKRWPGAEEWSEIIGSRFDLDLVQFSFDLIDPRVRGPVRAMKCSETKLAADKYGIEIHSTFTGLSAYSSNLLMHPDIGMRSDAIEWYEHAICMTKEMSARGTGGHVASLSCRDYHAEERRVYLLNFLVESLQHLSHVSHQLGLSFLLWEPMPVPREPPCNIEDAEALHEEVNKAAQVPIFFCVDTGHQRVYTESNGDSDIYQWVRKLGRMSPVIHLQQTDGRFDRHWPFTPKYNERGVVDPERLIESIEESGASESALILEIIHPFEEREDTVLEELELSVEYWKEYV